MTFVENGSHRVLWKFDKFEIGILQNIILEDKTKCCLKMVYKLKIYQNCHLYHFI